jgi:hypothetical protein
MYTPLNLYHFYLKPFKINSCFLRQVFVSKKSCLLFAGFGRNRQRDSGIGVRFRRKWRENSVQGSPVKSFQQTLLRIPLFAQVF